MSLREEQLPDGLRNAYQLKAVKKSDENRVIFGTLDCYHDRASEFWEEERAILLFETLSGKLYKLPYDNWNFTKIPMNQFEGRVDSETDYYICNDFDVFLNEAFRQAIKRHRSAGEGLKKGKLLNIGVADGIVYYEIVRVNKKTVSIEWRGFGADDYVDRRWGYSATIPHDEAEMFLCSYLDKEK